MDTNYNRRSFIKAAIAPTATLMAPLALANGPQLTQDPLIMHELAGVQYFDSDCGLALHVRYTFDHEGSYVLSIHKTALELQRFTPQQYADFDRQQFRKVLDSAHKATARKPDPQSIAKWSNKRNDGLVVATYMDAITNSNRMAMLNRRGCGNLIVTNPRQHTINKRLQCPQVTSRWTLLTHPDVPLGSYLVMYKGHREFDAGVILARHKDNPHFAAVTHQHLNKYATLVKFS